MSSFSYDCRMTNKMLEDRYGRHVYSNTPNFRVVWSDDQLEKRFGKHDTFAGDILVGEETGVHELPKYPWLHNQYVVERVHENCHQDVMEGQYTYEPLYAFPEGLPVKWEAVELVIQMALKAVPVKEIPRTEAQAKSQDDDVKKEEVKIARDMLGETSSVELAFRDKSAVSLSGSYKEN